jgi:hypothetical protein
MVSQSPDPVNDLAALIATIGIAWLILQTLIGIIL